MKYTLVLDGGNLATIALPAAAGMDALSRISFTITCDGEDKQLHAATLATTLRLFRLAAKPGDAPSAAEFAQQALDGWVKALESETFEPNDELVFETAYRYGNEYLTLEINPVYE